MDFYKLKIDAFKKICLLNRPKDVNVSIKSVRKNFDCMVSFVQTKSQLDQTLSDVMKNKQNITLMIAFPKGTSKRYDSEVNRDDIISAIKVKRGFTSPKLVSLDDDWSAFSFKYETDK